MGIETKTLGVLIDELNTTNMKIFQNLEVLDHMANPEAGALFKKTQTLNRRRSELIQAIDRKFGEGDVTITDKTYR
jgi:hypothetical protein